MSQLQSFLNATFFLWKREVIRFTRQRSRLIGALATPIMFWVLIGGGFSGSFQAPASSVQGGAPNSYFEFFFPGAIALSVLFTAIFSTISVIEDRHQGFLQGVLVSPVSRGALVLSKVLGGATMGVLQGFLLLLAAPFIGVSLSFVSLVEIAGLLFLMAACLTALGFLFAWKIDSVQGYHSIMNMILMPMWLLSGAVFPLENAHPVFKFIGVVNPLTYGVGALRESLWAGRSTSTSGMSIGWTFLLLLAVSIFLCFVSVRLVCRAGKKPTASSDAKIAPTAA